MASKVRIYNLALSHVGAKGRIQNPDEVSNEANKCNLHYDACLKDLQKFPYSFLKTSRSLSEVDNDFTQRWAYAYSEPSGLIKIERIVPEVDIPGNLPLPFGRRGGVLYCDVSPCELEYTRPVTDTTQFPAHFVDALSWSLAARICFPLTKDAKLRETTYQIAAQIRDQAEAFEANNDGPTDDWVPDHIKARR